MPRTSRFIEPNGFYHIISRSINDTWIIRDNDDFTHFFMLAHSAKQKYPIRIFHYGVMNTHFHLAVQAHNHEILSKNIAYLKWHYSLWMRKKYNWKGPLWRERYKSLLIENEDYLYACGMYIEYNPVRAGICDNPANYIYSSYRKYHLGIVDLLVDNYEINTNPNPPLLLAYHSDIAKNFFSHSPAIGTDAFINKFRKHNNACPKSDCP